MSVLRERRKRVIHGPAIGAVVGNESITGAMAAERTQLMASCEATLIEWSDFGTLTRLHRTRFNTSKRP